MIIFFVETRHGTSVQVWDFGWVFMIIGIFVGTMCTSSQYPNGKFSPL